MKTRPMGHAFGAVIERSRAAGQSPVVSAVLGTLVGFFLLLGLRLNAGYGLASLVSLGLLVALARSGMLPLAPGQRRQSGESSFRMPFLEQTIGYLLCLLWLEPPTLMALCVGFFLYRLLDVYPIPAVRRLRQAGTRDGLLLGQAICGGLGFCAMTLLRLTVLPGFWSAAR